MKTKGIILSGGLGTRLYPMTTVVNKQLLPVYDKPMIYYPLSTMVSMGIKDICIISSPDHLTHYQNLFKFSGQEWGLNIEFRPQLAPRGLPEAFTIAEDFLGDANVLILGDNIFHGHVFNTDQFLSPGVGGGAIIWAYQVEDPRRYGVVELDKNGMVISLEEKPTEPKSNYAVPGIYAFDSTVGLRTALLKPSKRNELEITDLIMSYSKGSYLMAEKMSRGAVWLDAGTPSSLAQASLYVQTIQERQGIMIGCIEEECMRQKFIDSNQMKKIIATYPKCSYRDYLERIL